MSGVVLVQCVVMESIRRQGLLPMSRLYVHLSGDMETARKVGGRHGRPVVLKVHSGDMYRVGILFYRSENGVWLTKKVAAKYFEQVEEIRKASGVETEQL